MLGHQICTIANFVSKLLKDPSKLTLLNPEVHRMVIKGRYFRYHVIRLIKFKWHFLNFALCSLFRSTANVFKLLSPLRCKDSSNLALLNPDLHRRVIQGWCFRYHIHFAHPEENSHSIRRYFWSCWKLSFFKHNYWYPVCWKLSFFKNSYWYLVCRSI